MLERDIERYLVEQLQAAGCLVYKFVSPQQRGVPDRLVIMPDGQVIFVELKAAHGRLSPLQRVTCAALQKHQANVVVLRGLEQTRLFIEGAKRRCALIRTNTSDIASSD